jgi:hypothetical protein
MSESNKHGWVNPLNKLRKETSDKSQKSTSSLLFLPFRRSRPKAPVVPTSAASEPAQTPDPSASTSVPERSNSASTPQHSKLRKTPAPPPTRTSINVSTVKIAAATSKVISSPTVTSPVRAPAKVAGHPLPKKELGSSTSPATPANSGSTATLPPTTPQISLPPRAAKHSPAPSAGTTPRSLSRRNVPTGPQSQAVSEVKTAPATRASSVTSTRIARSGILSLLTSTHSSSPPAPTESFPPSAAKSGFLSKPNAVARKSVASYQPLVHDSSTSSIRDVAGNGGIGSTVTRGEDLVRPIRPSTMLPSVLPERTPQASGTLQTGFEYQSGVIIRIVTPASAQNRNPNAALLYNDGAPVPLTTTLRQLKVGIAQLLGIQGVSFPPQSTAADTTSTCNCSFASSVVENGIWEMLRCRIHDATVDDCEYLHSSTDKTKDCSICAVGLTDPCETCLLKEDMPCPLVVNAGCQHVFHYHCFRKFSGDNCPGGCSRSTSLY